MIVWVETCYKPTFTISNDHKLNILKLLHNGSTLITSNIWGNIWIFTN